MAQEKGYFSRLAGAFGWRYVAAVCLQYGGNQGIGNRLNGSARSYYLLDSIGLDSAQMGSLSGFAGIPWQLKSLFGLLSDTLPIDGYHRSPYMMIGGTIGMVANAVLAFAPPGVIGYYAAALLFLACNLNVALADVMIDATVAEQTKRRPELGAELQALCWGALGGFGTFAFLFSGWALEHTGPRMLFACSIGSSACAAVPGALRWLGEPTPRARGLRLGVRDLCGSVWGHRTKRLVGLAAVLVGVYSVSLGLVQVAFGDASPNAVMLGTILGNCALCMGLWALLHRVDGCLARAIVYVFLQGALVPTSQVLFEWSHDPGRTGAGLSQDDRCFSIDQCAAAGDAARLAATVGGAGPAGAALPCGWARARGAPCISPMIFSWAGVVGSLALVGGTALYTSCFQGWTFRSIIATSQVLLLAVNLLDLAWVLRLNVAFGIPDELFILGDEVLADIVERLNSMPFLIFAAKLCPTSVEASMFALFMGLSNFGSFAGQYLGSGVLKLLGGVNKPDFAGLTSYVLLRSGLRLLPLLLVPVLVPRGTPRDTAEQMGAAVGVMSADGSSDLEEADRALRSASANSSPADESVHTEHEQGVLRFPIDAAADLEMKRMR